MGLGYWREWLPGTCFVNFIFDWQQFCFLYSPSSHNVTIILMSWEITRPALNKCVWGFVSCQVSTKRLCTTCGAGRLEFLLSEQSRQNGMRVLCKGPWVLHSWTLTSISSPVPHNRELLQKYSPHLTANAYRASASCEHCQSLPQSSTSSSFPPANSHLTQEGGQLQYLDLAGPSGYVTSYCCSPKIAVHFTFGVLCQSDGGILLRAFTQGGPGSTLLSQWLLFPFSFTLTVPAPELPGCCLRCRDKRSLTAAGAMRLVLDGNWVCTVLPAMLFNRGQCSAAHKRL